MEYQNRNSELDHLVERYQSGEKSALKELIRRFHPVLMRVIARQVRSAEPVEDIAQECWYAIIHKLEKVELKISFDVWAKAIARHKAIDWIRRQKRARKNTRELKEEMKAHSAKPASGNNAILKLQVAIRQLPPTRRIIIEMFYLENLSLQEISKVLKIPDGTVKSRLFHAREQLKDIINQ